MHRLTAAIAPRNLPKLRQTELRPVSQPTGCTFAGRGRYHHRLPHPTATDPDADAGKLFVLPTEWAVTATYFGGPAHHAGSPRR